MCLTVATDNGGFTLEVEYATVIGSPRTS